MLLGPSNTTSAWVILAEEKENREIQRGCVRRQEVCPVLTLKVILMSRVYEYVGADSGFESDMFTRRWDAHACLNTFVWLLIIPKRNRTHRHMFQLQWNQVTASSGRITRKACPEPQGIVRKQPTSDAGERWCCSSSRHQDTGIWHRGKEINEITAQVG